MKNAATIMVLLISVLAVSLAQAANRQELRGHVPNKARDLVPIARLEATNQLSLAISLPLRNTNELDCMLREIYDPASPNFRHYLSADEFALRFGPTEQDYAAVAAFCRSNGMEIVATHPNRTILDVALPVGTAERVFHTTLQVYQHTSESRTFYAPDVEPSMDLTTRVLGIEGLDSLKWARPLLKRSAPPSGGAKSNAGSGSGGNYLGKDFRAAYAPGVTLTGSGQVLGLVEFDGYYASDIASYEKLAGLSAVTLTNVLIGRFSGSPGSGNGEVALDIQVAIGMAPGLNKIIVYETGNRSSSYDILNRIATDNTATQISCSWTWGTYDRGTAQIFQQYAAQGQSFFQASGDSGAYVGTVDAPADNPYITVVGGTVLTTTSQAVWSAETAWGDQTSIGSGGGYSTIYTMPSWQADINMSANRGSTHYRNLPDVAMVADSVVSISDNGTTYTVSGTSIAAPLWAAFTALVNQQAAANGQPHVGFLNPTLYAVGKGPNVLKAFHDIISGDNTTTTSTTNFYAVAGYDLCTGWGSPTGSNTVNLLLQVANNQIDHFNWAPIATNLGINVPLTVTLTAQTANSTVASNFTAITDLSATQWQTNQLFSRDFESDSISDWTNQGGPYAVTIDATTGAAGIGHSLTLVGGDGTNSYNGLAHALTNISPDWVVFYVKAKANNVTSGYVVAGKTGYRTNSVFHFRMDASGKMGLTDGAGNFYATAYAANQWHKIALQLDWSNKVVNYYANDSLVMGNIPFCNSSLTSLAVINIYNFDNTQAWWDQFGMVKAVGADVPLSVANTGSFTNGVWSGLISVASAGTNIAFTARDSAGHGGASSFFTAIAEIVTVTVAASASDEGTVTGGGTFTSGSQQTITATANSGWGFVQWQDGVSQNPRLIIVPDTNITYTAMFAQQPQITEQPVDQVVGPGTYATFSITATGGSPLFFNWQRNGTWIANATNSSYTLNPSAEDSGSLFSCVVSNTVGTLTSQSAKLTVRAAFSNTGITMTPYAFTAAFSGTPGSNYMVQVSTDLQSWTPLITLQLTNGFVIFSDTNAKSPCQFYRLSGYQ